MGAQQLILLALIIEATWEALKMVWEDDTVDIDKIGALVFGLATAIVYNVDLLVIMDVTTSTNMLGLVFTGILISRGSNFVHDLIKKVGE